MNITVSLVIAIVGALLYGFGPPKAAELGRIMFFCGFLWFVYSFSSGRLVFGR